MPQEIATRIKIMSPNIITDKKPTIIAEQPPQTQSESNLRLDDIPIPAKTQTKPIISFETADFLLASMGLSPQDHVQIPIMLIVDGLDISKRNNGYDTLVEYGRTTTARDYLKDKILWDWKEEFYGFKYKIQDCYVAQNCAEQNALNMVIRRDKIEMVCSLKFDYREKPGSNLWLCTTITATGLRRKETV